MKQLEMNFDKEDSFKKELSSLINKYSLESKSSTPDFILADYLINCLASWDKTQINRQRWYSDDMK